MKFRFAILYLSAAFIWSLTASAAPAEKTFELTTPRGSIVKVDVYHPGESKVLLLAQGQGCSPRLDLYDAIAEQAHGFTVARLYWSYCVSGVGGASDDLSAEREDFLTVLSDLRRSYADDQILIGGKSLGSFVSQDVFRDNSKLLALVLLTPVCTNNQSKANEFEANYPGLSTETRPVLLAQGNRDPLCDSAHFQEFTQALPKNFIPAVFMGDHGLGVKNADGTYDAPMGLRNLEALAKWMFTWL